MTGSPENFQADSVVLCPSGSSSLLPAVRFGPPRLRGQTHGAGDDEVHPGDAPLPVLRVPPSGRDPGRPPADQQPVAAARGAAAGVDAPRHDLLAPQEAQQQTAVTPSRTYMDCIRAPPRRLFSDCTKIDVHCSVSTNVLDEMFHVNKLLYQ